LDAPRAPRIARGQAVALIGLRASGKSSVGAALAQLVGADFIDLDERTRAHLGATTVAEAFRAAGERAFREAEAIVLEATLEATLKHVRNGEAPGPSNDGRVLVLALGGGTPTDARSRAILETARSRGLLWIVFLDPPLEVLEERLRRDPGDRPSLTGRGIVEEVPEIAALRRPLYAALADFAVRESSSATKVAERLAEVLATGAGGTSGAAGRSQR